MLPKHSTLNYVSMLRGMATRSSHEWFVKCPLFGDQIGNTEVRNGSED